MSNLIDLMMGELNKCKRKEDDDRDPVYMIEGQVVSFEAAQFYVVHGELPGEGDPILEMHSDIDPELLEPSAEWNGFDIKSIDDLDTRR